MNMSTFQDKKVLVIIVAVLLLLLGGWYFLSSKKSAPSPSTETASGPQQPSGVSSLKDLITKGVAQNCTFSNAGTNGSVYVSAGKVRTDFDTTANNVTTKSHMIVMDNTSYLWIDGQTTGFKMSFDPNATPAAGSTAPNGSFDASANMDYKCSAWVADSSKFTLPTGITFTSFAVPTQVTPSGSSSSSLCSNCDSLTGDSKTQCLTALKCK
jgi:hypothetical protein